ncbi:MAG: hypothetical protein ACREX8_03460 [Gammaproteobacteria bacterium]
MRRRVGFLFICSAAIPIAIFAATAWACGTLTTLSSSPKAAAPNGTITVTGRNYGAVPANTNVQLRWNSRSGPIIKEVTPAELLTGTQVAVPNVSPGWYVINATQFNATTGVAKTGTPGRTTVRVQGTAASSNAPWGAAKPTGSGGPGGSPDLPLPAVLLSAALLATGLILVARGRGKKATRPVLGV